MPQHERNALPILSALIAILALVVAGVAVVVTNNSSGSGSSGGGGSGGAGAGAQTVSITLTEFSITPKDLVVPPGNVILDVKNNGTQIHNLDVIGLAKTPNLNPGEDYKLSLGDLKDSATYQIQCDLPGHSAAGMTGTLKVSSGGSSTGGGSEAAPTTVVSDEAMNASMKRGIDTFLQVNGLAQPQIPMKDWGKENQPMAPKVLADGTKEFDLEASEFDWEVEPGKIVKAWGYNGTVPGPIIHVQPGDKVRVVLTNRLNQTTSLHIHGCTLPNNMDGFDPVTGPSTLPGQSTVYEFTAPKLPTVCMYHSHHDAQVQVPMGLAGALLIGDLPLPTGLKADQETVMYLNDSGNIGLSLNGRSFPGTQGFVMKAGQSMLVHYYNEGALIHPMHMHGPHGLVVAKDGVPLTAPYYADTINVAPGERWSVLYTMPPTVKADAPDVWVWHCHILTHAETPMGYRYMATAVVVQPNPAVGTFKAGENDLDPRFSTYKG